MAVTKIHPIKTTLNKAIDYICNPDKTDNQILISSYGCSYQTADIEFGFTLSKARDKGDKLSQSLMAEDKEKTEFQAGSFQKEEEPVKKKKQKNRWQQNVNYNNAQYKPPNNLSGADCPKTRYNMTE